MKHFQFHLSRTHLKQQAMALQQQVALVEFVALDEDEQVEFTKHNVRVGPLAIGENKQKGRGRIQLRRLASTARLDKVDWYVVIVSLDNPFIGKCGELGECVAGPGVPVLMDLTLPFDFIAEEGRYLEMLIPRHLLDDHDEMVHGLVVSGALGAMLRDCMLSLYVHAEGLSEAETRTAVGVVTDFVRECFTSHHAIRRRDNGRGRQVSQMARVRAYMRAHLFDPRLSPEQICRQLGFSRAGLYRLFASSGGIKRAIAQMRLRKAYIELMDERKPPVNLTAMARKYGFTSARSFSYLFKEHFGCLPGEAREIYMAHSALVQTGEAQPEPIANSFGHWLRHESRLLSIER